MKKIILMCAFALCIGTAGYLFILPQFHTSRLNEAVPTSITASTTVSDETIMVPVPVVDTAGHPATGTVAVLHSDTGTIIRYENFKTLNGPDLFVYLSSDLKATEFVSLGALKATEGDINYEVPAEVDITKYRYVLVWCKQFSVLFNYADISQIAMKDSEQEERQMTEVKNMNAIALFANGCFWCVEHDLEEVPGVIDVVSGYAGGTTVNPTYKNYHDGGHREVVQVTYDPQVISYGNLVEHIIKHGDPTDAEGSFYDRGFYYAPAIYYKNDSEKTIAQEIIKAVDALDVFEKPLPLAVLPQVSFYPAEEYHQDYAQKNPLKYSYYRNGSGRNVFIKKYWGDNVEVFEVSAGPAHEPLTINTEVTPFNAMSWKDFIKPSEEILKEKLTPMQFEVTQEEGTEQPFSNEYDKNYEEGIYVDIISGEPLYFSKDKYDSGTGWPSFVKPISPDVVTLKVDKGLFSTRTEVRSTYADSHVGHVFDDGPTDKGGKRYCMNSAAMRFIPKADMEKEGYGYLLGDV